MLVASKEVAACNRRAAGYGDHNRSTGIDQCTPALFNVDRADGQPPLYIPERTRLKLRLSPRYTFCLKFCRLPGEPLLVTGSTENFKVHPASG